ncbi:inosine triphosphate pyrophosphatase-like [Haemaphysalis longicornis]
MVTHVVFVTGNSNKLREVVAILGKIPGFEFENRATEVPELQGDSDFICRAKCEAASQAVGGAVLVEDSSLWLDALGGLPGPYVKWFLDNIGPDGLYKMILGFEDKSAESLCTLAYSSGPGHEVKLFHGRSRGTIVPPRGGNKNGWDTCFQPEGYDQTYGEMCAEKKNTFSHRYRAVEAFRSFLLAQVH